MNTPFVSQLLEYFKTTYGLKADSAGALFETQRNLLEYLVCLGRKLENKIFEELGKGYEGATIEKEGRRYKFVDYRHNTIHGLFGEISYQRAYYVSNEEGGGGWIPFDSHVINHMLGKVKS